MLFSPVLATIATGGDDRGLIMTMKLKTAETINLPDIAGSDSKTIVT